MARRACMVDLRTLCVQPPWLRFRVPLMNALANPPGDAITTRQAREMNTDDGQGAEVFYGARLDPQRMLAIFRAHWWLFALVAALIFLAA